MQFSSGVTKLNKIRNEHERGTANGRQFVGEAREAKTNETWPCAEEG